MDVNREISAILTSFVLLIFIGIFIILFNTYKAKKKAKNGI